MPDVSPFRGLHYAQQDVTPLVTQPYDRIGEKLQREYYERHPHNFIRADKPAGADPYSASAKSLADWTASGVMLRDERPSFYAYYQVHSGGIVRKGFTAMVKLEDGIHRHEETHTGPKADRLSMIRATRAHISHVFLLYSDPEKRVNAALDVVAQQTPLLEGKDDYGETHKVWRVDDPAAIATIRRVLASTDAIIADGHHRYETAINYRNEMRGAAERCEGAETFENVLATLVNMDDGLTIFGTHRVIRDLARVDLSKIGELFDVSEPADIKVALARETVRPAYGLLEPGRNPRLLVVRDVKSAAAKVKSAKSEEWRSLDVNILHTVILDGMLGITAEHTAREMHIDYLRSADEAMDRVKMGKAQLAFLVNPVRMDQIRTIVAKGEKFPQKTTDFYPKLLSGLILCPLSFGR